jgi:hypothetical protein
MAQADDADIVAAWPPEGVSLRQSLRRAPGWPEYERASPGFVVGVARYFPGPVERVDALLPGPALSACTRWVEDQLQSGLLVLTCLSLEQPLVGPELQVFPAATTRYLDFDWELGSVSGPNNEAYYNPLIRSAASMPATAEPQRERPLQIETVEWPPRGATAEGYSGSALQTAIRSNKEWLEWAANHIQPDDNDLCKYGAKKGYAKKLADNMKIDAEDNDKLKALSATTIIARFNDRDLWPKKRVKKTTT